MKTVERKSAFRKETVSDSVSYRAPMMVTELYIYYDSNGYYVCPRCRITMEREFTSYCDRCGQCLNWKEYKKAKRTYVKHNEHR